MTEVIPSGRGAFEPGERFGMVAGKLTAGGWWSHGGIMIGGEIFSLLGKPRYQEALHDSYLEWSCGLAAMLSTYTIF